MSANVVKHIGLQPKSLPTRKLNALRRKTDIFERNLKRKTQCGNNAYIQSGICREKFGQSDSDQRQIHNLVIFKLEI